LVLGLDSELLLVGDAGTTEASRPSRRVGLEWTNYLRLNQWTTADFDLSISRARFTDDDEEVFDIDYYYESRLPGEATEGVADVHTHPAIPRSLRMTLQLAF
jgi:hypothetical protein